MYDILVFCEGRSALMGRHAIKTAAGVLDAIPRIMKDHPGCECVEVHSAGGRLFSVDCAGNTTPG
jgi:hypothetical protein